MAKLNGLVRLTDAEGVEHVFKPSDDLPTWAETALVEAWGKDREDIWAEAPTSKAAPAKAPAKSDSK